MVGVLVLNVDRRFNRARYEVALVAGAFAERVRREVDVEVIRRELCAAVGASVQPAAVRLWLCPDPAGFATPNVAPADP